MELDALQESLAEINSLGANLVSILPHLEEHSRALIEKKHFSFEMLSDPGNQVAKKFGLVYQVPEDLKQLYLKFGIDLEKFNNDSTWTLPLSTRYIIDGNFTIRYAEADPDYTIRPDPMHTIEALKSLRTG